MEIISVDLKHKFQNTKKCKNVLLELYINKYAKKTHTWPMPSLSNVRETV